MVDSGGTNLRVGNVRFNGSEKRRFWKLRIWKRGIWWKWKNHQNPHGFGLTRAIIPINKTGVTFLTLVLFTFLTLLLFIIPRVWSTAFSVWQFSKFTQFPFFRYRFVGGNVIFGVIFWHGWCYDLGLTGRFAGNVCQNLSLAVWANVGNVQTHWERQERWQRSRRVRRS